MFAAADLSALWLTLQLAFVTTLILLLISTPLAWWLAQSRWRYLFIIESLVALPLVLPPTVLGFYLLLMLGPQGSVGRLFQALGWDAPVFSFTGLVMGSVVYSLPFVVQPLLGTFKALGRRPLEVAATLRASPLDSFFSLVLPLAKPGFITATVLGFAHTLGEFGVVLMIGGNIPGETQVVSIAIYDQVESLQYAKAHALSLLLVALSALMLMGLYGFNRRREALRW